MPTFPAFTLTALGLDMQAQAELGGTLTFTRIALGAGAASNPSAATALVDQRMTCNIQQFLNMGSGNVRLRAVFSNSALATGFGMSEVGVFAQDPTTHVEQLYSYTKTTTPDYMPSMSGPALVEQIFDAIIAIGSATSVTAVIDDTVMIATKEDARWGKIAARTIYTTGTSQTHTFQDGIAYAVIEGLGGGGGGGGAPAISGGIPGIGGGGSAGGYFQKKITAALSSLTYSVGGAGGGGAAGQNSGSAGGDTVIVHNGTTYTAKGGGGGGSGASGAYLAAGGSCAAGSGGDILFPGSPGFPGLSLPSTTAGAGGNGGSSMFGSGGVGPIQLGATSGSDGGAAAGHGSGGAGGVAATSTLRAGGNGSGGLVIVTEYY